MAGKPSKLNPAQSLALAELREATKALQVGRVRSEIRIREAIAKEIDTLETMQSLAARKAEALGVSISRIGRDGIGTRDWNTAKRIIERTEAHSYDLASAGSHVFSWADKAEGILAIEYPNFPTTSLAPDYPPILRGTLRLNESVRGGVEVLTDESDEQTDFGTVPGMLRWEVETAPRGVPDSLVDLATAWMGDNA